MGHVRTETPLVASGVELGKPFGRSAHVLHVRGEKEDGSCEGGLPGSVRWKYYGTACVGHLRQSANICTKTILLSRSGITTVFKRTVHTVAPKSRSLNTKGR